MAAESGGAELVYQLNVAQFFYPKFIYVALREREQQCGQWKAKQHDASQPPSASIRSVKERWNGMGSFLFVVVAATCYVDTLGKKVSLIVYV